MTQFLVQTKSREFLSKVKFFSVFHISFGRNEDLSMRAKYFYGIVRIRKCSIRVNAVLGEGISIEGQVCSKIDFSGNEGSCHLGFTKDERKKSFGKYPKYAFRIFGNILFL